MANSKDKIFVSIPSQAKYIRSLRALISRAAQEFPYRDEDIREVVLAVDEACSNIIKHAYKGDENQKIELTLQLSPDSITVEIRDYGEKIRPKEVKPRRLDDVKPGGLGTHFMHCCMDSVEFDTSEPAGNLLRMTKTVTPGAGKGKSTRKQEGKAGDE